MLNKLARKFSQTLKPAIASAGDFLAIVAVCARAGIDVDG
jgi:hypothetical protein